MLREIRNVKQNDPALTRRWFQSDYFDLFVWAQGSGEISMFQLCYDLRRRERAFTWKSDMGFFHDGVDDGESGGPQGSGGHATPILTGADRVPFDAEKVNARFMRESADLPIEVRKLVLGKLHEYALTGEIRRNSPPRRAVRRDDWQQAQAGAAAGGEPAASTSDEGAARPADESGDLPAGPKGR